jgi:hypothetical protein
MCLKKTWGLIPAFPSKFLSHMSKHHTNKYFNHRFVGFIVSALAIIYSMPLPAQSRISYNNRQLFLSGSNIAWVSFAHDIGPDNTNFTAFQTMFDSVRSNHGNAMRFWLHTTGESSPAFGADGKVTGPGINTISDLKAILDLAWERKVGLMLCLWSFDMLRTSNGATVTDRSMLMLTDTSALSAYINNALIPMVTALKEHPGILSWEVFNEAEGMSDEYGWSYVRHVPMANIQRFVNRITGAIHRTDSTAKVTTGAWAFKALTDVTPLAKRVSTQFVLQSMNSDEKIRIEKEFSIRYNAKVSAEEIISRFNAVTDQNYYRDDRLIASGNDPLGTLDFYTVHYYSWAGTALSPFHHPASYWQLKKAIVVAEFFIDNTLDILYKYLYRNLYENGYAGALSWQWYRAESTQPNTQQRTKEVMNALFSLYPDDMDVTQASGKVYAFFASAKTIDSGDSTTLMWTTSKGSSAFLDGNPVLPKGSLTITPSAPSTYTLSTTGEVSDTARVSINFYPSGTIIFFRVVPPVIIIGDSATIYWRTSKGSATTLNDIPVNENDSLVVRDTYTNLYTLKASGTANKTSKIVLTVVKPEEMNRALNKPVTVVPYDSVSTPSSMVDGSFSTEWISASIGPTKILIDLQGIFQIQKVLLSWGTNYASQYRIGISIDGTSWTMVKQVLTGPGGQYTYDSLNFVCRYFWLQLDKCAFTSAANFTLEEIQLFGLRSTTAIQTDANRNVPTIFYLYDNYPNPFNPSTTIDFTVPSDGETSLKVFNILGKEVATLFHGIAKPGIVHRVNFHGDFLASGLYLARLTWNNHQTTRKLLLLR